jgi:hypothetical protein
LNFQILTLMNIRVLRQEKFWRAKWLPASDCFMYQVSPEHLWKAAVEIALNDSKFLVLWFRPGT